ncbi:MAG: calcium-binding protein [Pseudomonadota bacterium]
MTVDFTAGTASNGYGGTDSFNVNGFVAAVGSSGNDTFITTDTTRSIDGGAGSDLVQVDGTVNALTLVNVERVQGINPSAVSTGLVLVAPANGFNVDLTASGGADTIAVLGGNLGSIAVGDGDAGIGVVGVQDSITAGLGNDMVSAIGGQETIIAGNGTDNIAVVGGGNFISVGNGADTIVVTGGGNIILFGLFGTGNDSIAITGGGNFLQDAMMPPGDYTITVSNGGFDTILVNGNGNDTIAISGSNDVISAGNGNDTIAGIGGSETITAGGGSDVISISGGANAITIGAGSGDAIVVGGSHNVIDVVPLTGGGSLTINTAGFDAIAVDGDDALTISGGGDVVSTGPGTVSILLTGDAGTVFGGAGGNDTLTATGNGDVLNYATATSPVNIDLSAGVATHGGNSDQIGGFNYVIGSTGDDTIAGIGGSTIEGGPGNDLLMSAPCSGLTTLSYLSSSAGVNVNLGAGTASDGFGTTDTLSGQFAGVIGSSFGDVIDVSGGGGGVVVEGGAGNNTLIGSGYDELSYVHVPSGVVVDFSAGMAQNGYGGIDIISGFNAVQPGSGADTLIGTGSQALDYSHAPQPVVLDITSFFDPGPCSSAQTFVSGFSPVGSGGAAGDSFANFANLVGPVGSELVFTAGVTGSGLATIDLNFGSLRADDQSCATGISGFTAVDYQGTDNVSIYGNGAGGNFLSAGGGNDTIYDNGGLADTIVTGTGSDSLSLAGGHDAISLGSGSNSLTNFNDSIGSGANTVIGGNGNDVINLAGSGNAITLGSGADTVSGGTGNETISLGGGNDSISVSDGGNVISTGSGNVTMTGPAGGDTINVGSGADQITYVSPGDSFSSAPSAADAHTDVINNFQDTGATASVLDVAAIASNTQTFAGSRGTQPDFATAFSGDGPNTVDYAVINGNTFVHATGASGYSASDLLIELTGAHALSAANFHLGSGPPP